MEHILVGIGLVLGGIVGLAAVIVCVVILVAFAGWMNSGSH